MASFDGTVTDCGGHRQTLLPVQEITLKSYAGNKPDQTRSWTQAMPVTVCRVAHAVMLPLVLRQQA